MAFGKLRIDMITTTNKYNRTNKVQHNGQEMYVYTHNTKTDEVLISPDPKFSRAEDLFWVPVGELKEAVKQRVGIVSKAKVLTVEDKQWKDGLNKFFDIQITMIPADCE